MISPVQFCMKKVLPLNGHTKKTQRINNYSNYSPTNNIQSHRQSKQLRGGGGKPQKSFSPHPPSKTDKYRQISSNKCENSHGVCCKVLEESKPACPAYFSSSRYRLIALVRFFVGFFELACTKLKDTMISPVQFCMKKVLPSNGHTKKTQRINNYSNYSPTNNIQSHRQSKQLIGDRCK